MRTQEYPYAVSRELSAPNIAGAGNYSQLCLNFARVPSMLLPIGAAAPGACESLVARTRGSCYAYAAHT